MNPPMAQYECLEQEPRRFFFFGMTSIAHYFGIGK
jgi:hypothetical protein